MSDRSITIKMGQKAYEMLEDVAAEHDDTMEEVVVRLMTRGMAGKLRDNMADLDKRAIRLLPKADS